MGDTSNDYENSGDFDIRSHLKSHKARIAASNQNSARRRMNRNSAMGGCTPDVSGLRLMQLYQSDRTQKDATGNILSYKDHMKLAESYDLPSVTMTPHLITK